VVRTVGLAVLTEISSCTLGRLEIVVRSEAIATVRKIRHRLLDKCLLDLPHLQKIHEAAA